MAERVWKLDPGELAVLDRIGEHRDQIRQLEVKLRDVRRGRNLLILEAVNFGMSYRAIADRAGVKAPNIVTMVKEWRAEQTRGSRDG